MYLTVAKIGQVGINNWDIPNLNYFERYNSDSLCRPCCSRLVMSWAVWSPNRKLLLLSDPVFRKYFFLNWLQLISWKLGVGAVAETFKFGYEMQSPQLLIHTSQESWKLVQGLILGSVEKKMFEESYCILNVAHPRNPLTDFHCFYVNILNASWTPILGWVPPESRF